jgi:hypothetical protein
MFSTRKSDPMHCHGEHAFSYKSTLFTQAHPTHYTETCTRCFQYTPPKHMPVMPDGCTCMLRIALVASFAYARFAYEASHTRLRIRRTCASKTPHTYAHAQRSYSQHNTDLVSCVVTHIHVAAQHLHERSKGATLILGLVDT